MREPASDPAVACFAHGVAHLISELGRERGLAKAAQVLLELLEDPQLMEPAADDRRRVHAVSRN